MTPAASLDVRDVVDQPVIRLYKNDLPTMRNPLVLQIPAMGRGEEIHSCQRRPDFVFSPSLLAVDVVIIHHQHVVRAGAAIPGKMQWIVVAVGSPGVDGELLAISMQFKIEHIAMAVAAAPGAMIDEHIARVARPVGAHRGEAGYGEGD